MVRGCGESKDPDSVYFEFKAKEFGLPLEYFMIDPPKKWRGGQLRSPEKFTKDGITHLVLGVGKVNYPFVPDFLEESFVMGISKKVPRNFPFDELTPGKSRMLLIHPRVFPQFKYEVEHDRCPWEILERELEKREAAKGAYKEKYTRMIQEKLKMKPEDHDVRFDPKKPCLGDLWSLSYSKLGGNEKHRIVDKEGKTVTVKTPSVSYEINKPIRREYPEPRKEKRYHSERERSYMHITDTEAWNYGVFLAFPINTICYTAKEVPEHIKKKTEGFRLRTEEVEK